ncbi:polysaccharide biosynthesis/export family protein [Polaribacter cellanae]|uniref:Polysaccharide biosynthesis/export family protein n=1 Tax=Polaribacter cellanae TaxID=2818493 RepID=A0A975H816_9FLAO|nr:polysaccharide biosynthesis/export family protein [Polaribacter cellanae]QTE23564.1 polysaccharide biosynthesis/export family protein [Polaribacter cellanae]
MKYYITIPLLIIFFSSCVSNKDLRYLQGQPKANTEIKRINDIPYKLRIDDMVNIIIKSNNQELVSVFKKTENISSNTVNSNQSFSGNANYYSDYSVDNYGNIRVPTLGNVNVLGYTVEEVQQKIEDKLKDFVKEGENVFVAVKLAGIKYTIFGEIENPGTKIIYQNRVSILDAIANSGDITDVGNRKAVEIVRQTMAGTKKYTIDLTNIDAFNSEVFYIKPNDYINVLPLKQKSWGTGTTGLQSLTTVVTVLSLITSTIILARNL